MQNEDTPLLLRERARVGREGHSGASQQGFFPSTTRCARPLWKSERTALALVGVVLVLALAYVSTPWTAEAPPQQQQQQQREWALDRSSLAAAPGDEAIPDPSLPGARIHGGQDNFPQQARADGGRDSSSADGALNQLYGQELHWTSSTHNTRTVVDDDAATEGRWSGGGSGSERASERQTGGWRRSGRKYAPGISANMDGRSEGGSGGDGPSARLSSRARSSGSNKSGSGSSSSKPNVFFFLIDDMGYGDIGYQSTDLSELTPNLDALMEGGIKLSNYYSLSLCTPARSSLMTGRYPVRYGMQYSVIIAGAEWGLPLDEKVMPQYMNDAGYDSHMVGKWHLGGYNDASLPHRRGFETFLGYLNGVDTYYTHRNTEVTLDDRGFFDFGYGNETGYYDVTPTRDGEEECPDSARTRGGGVDGGEGRDAVPLELLTDTCYTGTYSTNAFLGRARQIVNERTPWDERPLFLYVAHQAVHTPIGPAPQGGFTPEEEALLEAVEARTGSAIRARFAGVLLYLDKKIGEFMDGLEKGGWLENSIIVVASDNGGCPNNGGCNYPLRGVKQSLFEGGTKVPAMIWSKSHIPEDLWGTDYNKMMHATDWVPTLTSAVGGELSGSAGPLDGVDHWDSMVASGVNGGGDSVEGPRTEMLYNWDPYLLSSTEALTENRKRTQGAFRAGKWKLMVDAFCTGYYSFDLAVRHSDPLIDASVNCPDTAECEDCAESCQSYSQYGVANRLFDLEADPREEHDVLQNYPEIADRLLARATEVVYSEWTESNYDRPNTESYFVWKAHNWWMVPWDDKPATPLAEEAGK